MLLWLFSGIRCSGTGDLMSQMRFWSLSQYIHLQVRMEVTFWPHYGRKMVFLCVRWSTGAISLASTTHKPSACTSCTGFMYFCIPAVRIISLCFFVCVCTSQSLSQILSYVYFPINLLSFFNVCQCPLSYRWGRGQVQHPNLPTWASYSLCVWVAEGGGTAGSHRSPSFHGTEDILQPFSYSTKKKSAQGKHLL